jgi:hypothetical protein
MTKNKLPEIGTMVKFRIEGDKHLHDGTYTAEGFQACMGLICYTTNEVDYWRRDIDREQWACLADGGDAC